jgi:hypothetical protein
VAATAVPGGVAPSRLSPSLSPTGGAGTRLAPILPGSIAFTRAIDEAAANMVALWRVLEGHDIAVQGVVREAYRS